jgi:hypothetical protein
MKRIIDYSLEELDSLKNKVITIVFDLDYYKNEPESLKGKIVDIQLESIAPNLPVSFDFDVEDGKNRNISIYKLKHIIE